MAEHAVRIEDASGNRVAVTASGALTTTPDASGTQTVSGTVNQGTAAAQSNAWYTRISNGTIAAGVVAPTTGSPAVLVAAGSGSAGVSLNAVTGNATGSSIDLGAAHRNVAFIVSTTGTPTGGTVTLEVSVDGTAWFTTATTAAVGSSVTMGTLQNTAVRFVRTNLTGLTGGTSPTVTAKVMGS